MRSLGFRNSFRGCLSCAVELEPLEGFDVLSTGKRVVAEGCVADAIGNHEVLRWRKNIIVYRVLKSPIDGGACATVAIHHFSLLNIALTMAFAVWTGMELPICFTWSAREPDSL